MAKIHIFPPKPMTKKVNLQDLRQIAKSQPNHQGNTTQQETGCANWLSVLIFLLLLALVI